jgi:hypothetical protein
LTHHPPSIKNAKHCYSPACPVLTIAALRLTSDLAAPTEEAGKEWVLLRLLLPTTATP